ncbi:MAG TPA: hypothetical protein VLD57_07265 [Blastocatellia bacterium]|nr:hypothetical protein [Blastocatellia bacterium]
MNLDLISQVMSGQLPVIPPSTSAPKGSLFDLNDRSKTTRLGFLTLWGGIVLAALIGIIGGALSNIAGDVGGFVASLAGIGGLVFMIGIGLLIYSRFLPKPEKTIQPQQNWLPPQQPYIDMQQDFEQRPAGSVTENTTELFDKSRNSSRQ